MTFLTWESLIAYIFHDNRIVWRMHWAIKDMITPTCIKEEGLCRILPPLCHSDPPATVMQQLGTQTKELKIELNCQCFVVCCGVCKLILLVSIQNVSFMRFHYIVVLLSHVIHRPHEFYLLMIPWQSFFYSPFSLVETFLFDSVTDNGPKFWNLNSRVALALLLRFWFFGSHNTVASWRQYSFILLKKSWYKDIPWSGICCWLSSVHGGNASLMLNWARFSMQIASFESAVFSWTWIQIGLWLRV